MSKHTNSLLLRYGINIFWSASISNPNLEYRHLFFFNVFNFFFRNFNIHVFKIQYSLDVITVYVFPYKNRFNFMKQYIFYFEKRVLTKLNIRKFYGFKARSLKKKYIKLDKEFNFCIYNVFLLLVLKRLMIKYLFYMLKKDRGVNFNSIFFFFHKKKFFFFFYKKI